MTVSEVMTASVHSVAPEISADDARAMMRRHRVHHLVVKKASNWVGIVSAHDLARRSPARRTRPVKIGDVMTRHVMTLDEQASVDRASPETMLKVLLLDLAAGPALPVTVAVYELVDGEVAVVIPPPFEALSNDRNWRKAQPALARCADDEAARLMEAAHYLTRTMREHGTYEVASRI